MTCLCIREYRLRRVVGQWELTQGRTCAYIQFRPTCIVNWHLVHFSLIKQRRFLRVASQGKVPCAHFLTICAICSNQLQKDVLLMTIVYLTRSPKLAFTTMHQQALPFMILVLQNERNRLIPLSYLH